MVQLTDQQIEAQIDRAIANQANINAVEARVKKVSFENGRIILYFNGDAVFSFLPKTVEEISTLSPQILATVELTPSGKGLRWEQPDIDLSVQGLLLTFLGGKLEVYPGTKAIASSLG